jgi:hypothetical protein
LGETEDAIDKREAVAMSGPWQRAKLLEALVAVLLPGDALFPSAAAVGVQAKLAERLVDSEGERALEAVLEAAEGLAAAAPGEAQRAVVQAFESDRPALFASVRNICFIAYYESPFVQEAIRSLGFAYNAAPLPKGYGIRRFDMAKDRPTHGRGRYVPTEEVARVDLSGLDIKELGHGG